MIPDFEIKVTPGSYEEVSERFKTYLRFRFGIDPASVFITGATGSGKSTASISLAIQYVKQGHKPNNVSRTHLQGSVARI